jgi:acyl-coenzyme A synthetase/AMP-(fatty) acid ligase
MRLLPHVGFFNLYGPTETNVCTFYEVAPIPDGHHEPIPIGKAIDNVEVFAVDDQGRPVASGEVGELLVRGATVMCGYWNDPERTTRSLVPAPHAGPSDRAYRTGDLVRERPDGHFQFLGRRDNQIKSRGYRIELGEIETALQAHPAVVECAVVAIPDETISNRIHAVVAAREGIDHADLARFCATRIPEYMIPETFDLRDSLPKTSTGKIDRQVLLTATTSAKPGGK